MRIVPHLAGQLYGVGYFQRLGVAVLRFPGHAEPFGFFVVRFHLSWWVVKETANFRGSYPAHL